MAMIQEKDLSQITTFFSVLQREGLKLLMPFFDRRENPRRKLIRLLGLRVEKLI